MLSWAKIKSTKLRVKILWFRYLKLDILTKFGRPTSWSFYPLRFKLQFSSKKTALLFLKLGKFCEERQLLKFTIYDFYSEKNPDQKEYAPIWSNKLSEKTNLLIGIPTVKRSAESYLQGKILKSTKTHFWRYSEFDQKRLETIQKCRKLQNFNNFIRRKKRQRIFRRASRNLQKWTQRRFRDFNGAGRLLSRIFWQTNQVKYSPICWFPVFTESLLFRFPDFAD